MFNKLNNSSHQSDCHYFPAHTRTRNQSQYQNYSSRQLYGSRGEVHVAVGGGDVPQLIPSFRDQLGLAEASTGAFPFARKNSLSGRSSTVSLPASVVIPLLLVLGCALFSTECTFTPLQYLAGADNLLVLVLPSRSILFWFLVPLR